MTTSTDNFPSPADFYLKLPLYEPVTVLEGQERDGWLVQYFKESIDSYCPECGAHSVFRTTRSGARFDVDDWVQDHLFDVNLECSRNREHHLYFIFKLANRELQKIGQYPSIATLNLFDAKKYSRALEKAYFQEFTKAIGLAAHGVGVGSFVYLRRIFEHLIEQAHLDAASADGWDEQVYEKLRMAEKIHMLRFNLPDFLVQNKSMYGILSKGVHELTEAECLAAFPVVKVGIEIILDERLHKIDQDRKLEDARKALQSLG